MWLFHVCRYRELWRYLRAVETDDPARWVFAGLDWSLNLEFSSHEYLNDHIWFLFVAAWGSYENSSRSSSAWRENCRWLCTTCSSRGTAWRPASLRTSSSSTSASLTPQQHQGQSSVRCHSSASLMQRGRLSKVRKIITTLLDLF